jgi:hypothetical protein
MNFIKRLVFVIPFATSVRDYPYESEQTDIYKNCVSHEELIRFSESQELHLYEKDHIILTRLIVVFCAICIIFKLYHEYIIRSLKHEYQTELDFKTYEVEMLQQTIVKINKTTLPCVECATFDSQNEIIKLQGYIELRIQQ